MKKTAANLVAFTLLALAAGCEPASSNPDSSPPPAKPAEQVTLQTLDYDGIQKLVASHRGKVVVMDAWSTSCPPCIKEFPNLVKLHRDLGDQVACISLSFDNEGIAPIDEVKPKVLAFLKSQDATFDNVVSTEDSDTLNRKFKLISVPAVFVYDRTGTLVKRFDNESAAKEADAFTYEQVRALVEELLKDKKN